MSSVTSKVRDSTKISERLPAIEDPLNNQKSSNKKWSSTKMSISNINLPKLNSIQNSAVRLGSDAQEAHEVALFNSLKCVENVQQLLEGSNFKSCSNAVGPTECQLLFKVPSSELNEVLEIEEEKLEESKAIKRWEYWMKDKTRLQNYFSKSLERSPCDLLIQKSDKIRQLVEEKSLLEYSQIPEADKWRGHPYRWKSPVCLSNRRSLNCDLDNSPKYCAVQSKSEKNEISEMEFVGIPKTIQKEKGLICKSEKPSMNIWERMSYRQERINYFMKQRKKLKPHEIQMDDLEVVGTKISQKQEEIKESVSLTDVPEIIITTDESDSQDCLDYRPSVFCLVIDGEEIKYELGTDDCQNPSQVSTWEINFGVVTVRTLEEKILKVENRGTIAVSFDWLSRNIEQKQSLDILQQIRHEPWFFFDKNSGFFLPGQIYDLKFYFYAKRSGVRKEVWYLRTKPPFSKNQEIIKIVLSAVATEEISEDGKDLEAYLKKRVRDSVVAFAIKILFYKVFKVSEGLQGIEYRSMFCEKDLFEYHNSKYYYHSACVKTLKELFEEIPSKSQSEWDLSLDTLIALIKTYNEKEKNGLLLQISEKAKKLLRPNYLSVKSNKKYRMSYEILCKMTNFMEEDYNYLINLVSEKTEQNEEKTWSEEEIEDLTSSFTTKSEEMGESSRTMMLIEIKPKNLFFFKIMFYIKVYHRVCEAVEQIVAVLETRKLFQPRRQYEYKLEKPTQINKKKCFTGAF